MFLLGLSLGTEFEPGDPASALNYQVNMKIRSVTELELQIGCISDLLGYLKVIVHLLEVLFYFQIIFDFTSVLTFSPKHFKMF